MRGAVVRFSWLGRMGECWQTELERSLGWEPPTLQPGHPNACPSSLMLPTTVPPELPPGQPRGSSSHRAVIGHCWPFSSPLPLPASFVLSSQETPQQQRLLEQMSFVQLEGAQLWFGPQKSPEPRGSATA